MIAQVKLTWKRNEFTDKSAYWYDLYLRIGKSNVNVASVNYDLSGGWLFVDGDKPFFKNFKTMDDAKAYTEKRVIKYFGLKENTDV